MVRKSALLLTLTLGIHPAFAGDEIFNNNDKNQILSSIKDVEVVYTLKKTSEYSNCAKDYTFQAGADDATRSAGLKKAQECFLKEINQNNDPKKLEELSNKLGLQQYGLVQSNSSKEIQSYLNDKLYQALTGIDRKEQDQKKQIEAMKFKNMKQVDQSVFIQLYKNQLGKNALAEISRFCFEKLRLTNITEDQFDKHWASYTGDIEIPASTVNDLGIPSFTNFSDTKDSNKIYQEIFASIQGTFNEKKLSNFFLHCGKLITPLCNEYKTKQDAASTLSVTEGTMTSGAAACLTQSRIQDFKKAIAAADLVIKDFQSLSEDQKTGIFLALDGKPKIYGADKNDKGIDELTNLSSADILLKSGSDDELEKIEQACINGDKEACGSFASTGDSLDKAKHNIELQMTLKREVEKKRVAVLKGKNDDSLEEYLKANGFMELLENDKYKTMDVAQLQEEIGKSFEARKNSLILEINNKLGKRQVKKGDDVQVTATSVIKDVKEEKARMTQVVLFHNIISSFLTLKREDDPNAQGRNVETWNKEEEGLKAASVDSSYFENIKASNEKADKIDSKNSGMNFDILDQFLK